MKINNINQINFGKSVIILASENKKNTYLYNQISDMIKEHHVPGIFQTNAIELPSVTEEVLKKVKELGIKYSVMK